MQPSNPTGPRTPSHLNENYTAPEFDRDTPVIPAQPAVIAPQFPTSNGEAPHENHPDYEFILNPAANHPKKMIAGETSMAKRIGIVVGGLILLIIIFSLAKSVLSKPSPNAASLLSVVQEQQELAHVSAEASKQQGIQTTTADSAATITATIGTEQPQLETYIRGIGLKYKPIQYSLRVSAVTDAALATAASGGTYDQVYETTVQTVLQNYEHFLKLAYSQTTGLHGRAILTVDYNSASLLLTQLTTPAS
jgi:hypothetical protein